ncbi:MAG: PhoH family protein [Candidatus Coatesbacteria bacterium]|nr:PhoH family protein [Candidatus Coatesbacteria bacterium]
MERIVDFAGDESLRRLLGSYDSGSKLIEDEFGVVLISRGSKIKIRGEDNKVLLAEDFLRKVALLLDRHPQVDDALITDSVHAYMRDREVDLPALFSEKVRVPSRDADIYPKSENQKRYVRLMQTCDIVFSIGPAGTGKTYLAMAIAVSAFVEKKVKRIVLARPAIEAGERLGFLPGDLKEKVMPYLRPLYDALYDMIPMTKTTHLIESGAIEIAPLAYMRGRTLNSSFAILDEAQNTTPEQMKMFLTRLGKGSRAVITGDITQIDLPPNQISGLVQVQSVLSAIKGIEFLYFTSADVVRHNLVQKIIDAYEAYGRSAEHISRPLTAPNGRARMTDNDERRICGQ